MEYTLKELIHLRNVRLKGFNESNPQDDLNTNEYFNFENNTEMFLEWIKSMESAEF